MINQTGLKVAKKYEPMIEEIYKDFDGVWAHAEAGYKFESSDTHTERQDTQKDLYKTFKTLVPCDCEECEYIIIERIEEENSLEEVEEVQEEVQEVEREIEEYHFEENEENPNESTQRLLFEPLREEMGYKDFTVHKIFEQEPDSEKCRVTLAVRYMKDGEKRQDNIKEVKFYHRTHAIDQYFNTDNYSFYAKHLGKETYDLLDEAMFENYRNKMANLR